MHEEYAHIGEIHTKLIEEIGELLQAWGKYERFGPDSKHPDDLQGPDNCDNLLSEIDDVLRLLLKFKDKIKWDRLIRTMSNEIQNEIDREMFQRIMDFVDQKENRQTQLLLTWE